MNHRLRGELCFIAAALVIIPFLIPALNHMGTPYHTYLRYTWWTCMALSTIFVLKNEPFDNPIGSIFCIVFGPVTLLSLGFFKWSLKRWPEKVVA